MTGNPETAHTHTGPGPGIAGLSWGGGGKPCHCYARFSPVALFFLMFYSSILLFSLFSRVKIPLPSPGAFYRQGIRAASLFLGFILATSPLSQGAWGSFPEQLKPVVSREPLGNAR